MKENEVPMVNLIQDSCYPALSKDGNLQYFPLPEALACKDISTFHTPRPDLNGALVQFVIGLLQTVFAPEDEKEWLRRFREPPGPEELDRAIAPLAAFFNLDGDGPRFMQDLELEEGDSEEKPISTLLIDAPGGNTLKNNLDHFNKRHQVPLKLSPFYAALALYCLQCNAPSGGVGHRTSLRGGGPLTTLIRGETLWETLWMAVLPKDRFFRNAPEWREQDPASFLPWLIPTQTSEKKGSEIHAAMAHPLTVYWAMPRRIRLTAPVFEPGTCDLSGDTEKTFYTGYVTKNYGHNYGSGWVHPLTPHYQSKDGERLPVLGQPGGIGYRHWAGLVFKGGDAKSPRSPAPVIEEFVERRARKRGIAPRRGESAKPRLWVFGYDMDNMKARGWLESTMPIIPAESNLKQYAEDIRHMVAAAQLVVGTLKSQVKAAFNRQPNKARGDYSFVEPLFWEKTEPAFYAIAESLSEAPEQDQPMLDWLFHLHREAKAIFDAVLKQRPLSVVDPKPVINARRDLIRYTHPNGKKVRKTAGLPPAEKKKKEAPVG